MDTDGMDDEEAEEYCSYNIEGAYVGPHTPIIVWPYESAEMTKVFGPPGSGKTTYLLNVVEKELAGGRLIGKESGYFSFTRKAAHEARDRAIEKFPYPRRQGGFSLLPNPA
jgi:ABC-type lipoprotein export system ATPase subunit